MTGRIRLFAFVAVLPFALALAAPSASAAEGRERLLIRSPKPYDQLAARIQQLGGRVDHEFRYVDAVAAEVPRDALPALTEMLGESAVTKDVVIPNPAPVDVSTGRPGYSAPAVAQAAFEASAALSATDLRSFAAAHPNAYLINNDLMGVTPLLAAGITGDGIDVAVIDSGLKPGYPHIELDGSIIGCEDFVGDVYGCSNPENYGHGTFVAGMISGDVIYTFSTSSGFRNAVLAYCPECFLDPPTYTQIPLFGSAPLSSIYALRVFPPTGGAPTSRILEAVERVIELKEKFRHGEADGVDFKVVNMSLGGPTLYAGRDLYDQEVAELLRHDIVPVVSAGNAGPSSLTVGSPGTSLGVVTVGAASEARHERILRDLQYGPGVGALYRPFDGIQSAYFSSRGPDADGRVDPDVVANGFASFGQGFGTPSSIDIASGTSFSSPSTAGIAALLREAFPKASPALIRNAIIASANPHLLADGSDELDQGHGFVDALAAAKMLQKHKVPFELDCHRHSPAKHHPWKPALPTSSVAVNIERGTDLDVLYGTAHRRTRNLLPGQRKDFLYYVGPHTRQVMVTLAGFDAALPADQQNAFFGDDVILSIHSAKTSAIGEGDYKAFTFTTGTTQVIDDPEPGVIRVTVSGDWTNAGKVSAEVWISSTQKPLWGLTSAGKVKEGQSLVFPVQVPSGVSEAEFRLSWDKDWASYPTSDLDMVVYDPTTTPNLDGASLNSPEVVKVTDPAAGTWLVQVIGYEIYARKEYFKLRVALDGHVVH
jgi:serine protease AprX